jgi:hypothetical protein
MSPANVLAGVVFLVKYIRSSANSLLQKIFVENIKITKISKRSIFYYNIYIPVLTSLNAFINKYVSS